MNRVLPLLLTVIMALACPAQSRSDASARTRSRCRRPRNRHDPPHRARWRPHIARDRPAEPFHPLHRLSNPRGFHERHYGDFIRLPSGWVQARGVTFFYHGVKANIVFWREVKVDETIDPALFLRPVAEDMMPLPSCLQR